jgi:nucleoside-diphosphate-sugar epimerase
MRLFVTGASGFIGSAVVTELQQAGHQVLGLARSDASAGKLEAAGADVLRGDLDDLDSLRAGATGADGVVHLAYVHDFAQMEAAAKTDLAAIEAMGSALEGSGKPIAIASGTLGLAPGRVGTERDDPQAVHPRVVNARATLALADRGVRPLVVRLSPTVHGPDDHGFIAAYVQIARDRGVAGYVDDGQNRWNAVHRDDAAAVFRLAVEQAPAGSVLHAVGEEGIPVRTIAEVVGRGLDLPTRSIPADQAAEHFGWLGAFLAVDAPASSTITQELLGWKPTGPGLLDDIAAHYV